MSEPVDDSILQLRATARWRSMILPGAGYALLGHGGLAWRTLIFTLAPLAAIALACFYPEPLNLGVAVLLVAFGSWGWLCEQRTIKSLQPIAGKLHPLDRWFMPLALAVYLVAAWVLVLGVTSFGALVVSDDSAIAGFPSGSRVLFHRRVNPSQLRSGTMIVFRANADDQRDLYIGRILAAPDDKVIFDKKSSQYLVNGQPAGKWAEPTDPASTAEIPAHGDPLEVPKNIFYVALDTADDQVPRHLTQLHLRSIVGDHLLLLIAPGRKEGNKRG